MSRRRRPPEHHFGGRPSSGRRYVACCWASTVVAGETTPGYMTSDDPSLLPGRGVLRRPAAMTQQTAGHGSGSGRTTRSAMWFITAAPGFVTFPGGPLRVTSFLAGSRGRSPPRTGNRFRGRPRPTGRSVTAASARTTALPLRDGPSSSRRARCSANCWLYGSGSGSLASMRSLTRRSVRTFHGQIASCPHQPLSVKRSPPAVPRLLSVIRDRTTPGAS